MHRSEIQQCELSNRPQGHNTSSCFQLIKHREAGGTKPFTLTVIRSMATAALLQRAATHLYTSVNMRAHEGPNIHASTRTVTSLG